MSLIVHSLYLCYFGLREPLVQSQVLPYLRFLARSGVRIKLLTFEPVPPSAWADEAVAASEALRAEGIEWEWRRYHKRPTVSATLLDVIGGAVTILRVARHQQLHIVHARAHVACAMALLCRPLLKARLIFDIRGLVADEYVDAGVWSPHSIGYRLLKLVERAGIRSADGIVVLTHALRRRLERTSAVVAVIPCCVDLDRFIPAPARPGPRDGIQLIYAGSTTGLYRLHEMLVFFAEILNLRPTSTFEILTHGPRDNVRGIMRELGIPESACSVRALAPEDIPGALAKAHLGISLRTATPSQVAASPTKVGEYLACGLPVVSSKGIGDTDDLLKSNAVGIVLDDLSRESLRKGAQAAIQLLADPGCSARCRQVAEEAFSLIEVGGASYSNLYRQLMPGGLQ